MGRRAFLRTAALALVAAGIACAPIPPPQYTAFADAAPPDIRARQIKRAGIALGWAMENQRPGVVRGTLNVRNQRLVVDVAYDAAGFSIAHVSNVNMGEGDTIHYNYGRWVRNLQARIVAQPAA